MKKCVHCKKKKSLSEFYLRKDTEKYRNHCKDCMSESHKKYYDENLEQFYKRNEEYYKSNKESCLKQQKIYYATTIEKQREDRKIYQKNNPEAHNKATKKYTNKNKELYRFYSRTRQALKRQVCPNWVNKEELKNIYLNCPKGFEVDHIIPIKNNWVTGLHVPWNLQYLKNRDNNSKKNKFDFTYKNEGWKNA